MSKFGNVEDGLRAALKAEEMAARAAGKAAELGKGFRRSADGLVDLPPDVAAKIDLERKLGKLEATEGVRTAGAKDRADTRAAAARAESTAKQATARAEAQAAVDAGRARTAAAQAEAQSVGRQEAERRATASHQVDELARQKGIELHHKKLDARAKYDSYIEHKLAEAQGMPPRRIPTTVSEHLDDLTPLSNLHITATEYVSQLKEFGEKLGRSKLLVNRRTFTKDIPTTKDDRDIRSIEHLMHHGKPITAREYERFMSARVRQHHESQAREMRLLEGNLQDTPIPSAPGPGAPASLIGGTGTPSTGAAFLSLMTAAVNRIPSIPRSDILTPGLRYIPLNPTPAVAGIALAVGITGVVDIKTDGDLTLGPTARLIDNASGFMVDNIKETGPDGKETGHEIGIGLYRSLLMTNTILQSPGREKTFAAGVADGKADEGLKAVFLKAKMQPAQQKQVTKANVDAKVEKELAEERERQLPELKKAVAAQAAASQAGGESAQADAERVKQQNEARARARAQEIDMMRENAPLAPSPAPSR